MGMHSSSTICYGIFYEDGYEFPWDDGEDNYIDKWWIEEIMQFKPTFNPFDENGNYAKGVTGSLDPRINEYFKERNEFGKLHPLPVTLINYCSGDESMYIISTLGSHTYSGCADPTELDFNDMKPDTLEVMQLIEFCQKYCPSDDLTPKWYLSTYWG